MKTPGTKRSDSSMNTLPVLITDSQQTTLHHLSAEDVLQLEKALASIIGYGGFGGLDVKMEEGGIRSFGTKISMALDAPQTKKAKRQATPTHKGLYQGNRSQMLHHLPSEYIKWLDKRIGYLKEVNGGFGIIEAKVEYDTIREVTTTFTERLPKENSTLQNIKVESN